MADPNYEQTRREIALQLKQHERDLAMGGGAVVEPPQPLDPRSMRPKEPGGPSAPAAPSKPSKVGTYDAALGYIPDPRLDDAANQSRAAELKSAHDTLERETSLADKAKETARAGLAMASLGSTEAVSGSVAGAAGKAAGEVEGKTLETMDPKGMVDLMVRAGLIQPEQQQAVYAAIKPHWQPGTRTDTQSSTGKDPNAVRAAMDLQTVSERAQSTGLEQTQRADSANYDMLQKAQQNEMSAIKAFKDDNDAIQDRYDRERQAQIDKMASIQKAMDTMPDAPRTIREWLDRTGTGQKMAFGLAAAFSSLGGAVSRDGGQGMQTLLSNVQGNIDREVQRQTQNYETLGKRAEMSNNIYARLREGIQDSRTAQNVTKALYYDALANTVQQIATQYKMDTQSPQIQAMLSRLAEQRQKLILDTANTMQSQFSQTDKFNPGGVVQVGGGARKDPNEYKSTDLEKDTQKFSKELDERGFNMGERAMGLYQKALGKMREAGFKNDENFKRAFVTLADPQASPAKQAAVLVTLDKPEREALQYIVSANKEQLKDAAGKSVTANELVRDVIEKGGYSPDSLEQVRRVLAANREQIYKGVARGYDPRVWQRSDARGDLAGMQREHAGIGTEARQPVDVKDIATKVEGRLSK